MQEIMKKEKYLEIVIAVGIIILGILFRLIPHAPNFAPVTAVALFAGFYLSKKTALFLPIILMFVSDIFLGFYDFRIMASVYISFIFCSILGVWLKNHKKWQTIFGGAVLGSVVFFIFTNLAVFIFTPWYQKNVFGLIQCYAMALPFFRNTLLGDLFYTSVFFGAYEFANILVKNKFREVVWNKK